MTALLSNAVASGTLGELKGKLKADIASNGPMMLECGAWFRDVRSSLSGSEVSV